MKKTIVALAVFASAWAYSQEKAVDVFSAKAGLIGAWISYEKALTSELTLQGEIGYEGGIFYNSMVDDQVNYVLTTALSLEGRYYYNFNRRIEKGKKTFHNAANFLALETTYTPDWGTSSNSENVAVLKTFSIIPKYGLRRNLSKKINFEFSAGPGYQWVENGNHGVTLGLDVNFGFVF